MAGRVFQIERPLEVNEPRPEYKVERPKWQKALACMDDVCRAIGEPITEGQRTVMAGVLAVWLP